MTTFCSRAVLTVSAALLLPTSSMAQAIKQEVPEVDVLFLGQDGVFASDLPFDVPFLISGTAPNSVSAITLEYREATPQSKPSPPRHWRRTGTTAADASFLFLVDALRAGRKYKFSFTNQRTIASLPISGAVAQTMRAEIDRLAIRNNQPRTLTDDEKEDLEDDLNDLLAGDFFVDVARSADELTALIRLRHCLHEEEIGIPNARDPLLTFFGFEGDRPFGTPAEHVLVLALRGLPIGLDARSQEAWNRTLNPESDGDRLTTGEVATQFIESMRSGPNSLADLLVGAARFGPEGVTASTTPHPESFVLLAEFLEIVGRSTFRRADGTAVVPDAIRDTLRDQAQHATQLAAMTKDFNAATVKLRTAIAAFPVQDVINAVVIAQRSADGKNPHVTLDLGVGVAPELESAFVYSGATFYLKPVNPNAELGELGYPWSERILKSVGFFVGYTLDMSSTSIENLSPKGVVVGAGWRVGRYGKLSAGALLINRTHANPLIDETDLKTTPFFAASLDASLGEFIKGLGKVF